MCADAEAAEDTREAIMSATYRALCKHGYANLTMQNIADEFDKSKSLLHYHYDTKEELLLAFLDRMIGWLADRMAESDTEHPLDRLEEYAGKYVIDPDENGRETFALAVLELRVQAVHNDAFQEKLARHYERNVETAAAIIEDGIEEGVFREVDPYATGEMLITALEGARLYQVTLDAKGSTQRMYDALLAFVVEELLTEEG